MAYESIHPYEPQNRLLIAGIMATLATTLHFPALTRCGGPAFGRTSRQDELVEVGSSLQSSYDKCLSLLIELPITQQDRTGTLQGRNSYLPPQGVMYYSRIKNPSGSVPEHHKTRAESQPAERAPSCVVQRGHTWRNSATCC